MCTPTRPNRLPAARMIAAAIVSIIGIASLIASGGNSSSGPPPPYYSDAGHNVSAKVNQEVWLNGTGTIKRDWFEPEDMLSTRWDGVTLPAESTTRLPSEFDVITAFIPDVPGEYEFRLQAKFSSQPISYDRVTIEVTGEMENGAPNALAGPYQYVRQGMTVLLDARKSDDPDQEADHQTIPDLNLISYEWQFNSPNRRSSEKPDGSGAVIVHPDSPNPTFVPDMKGLYLLLLIVRDIDSQGNVLDEDFDHVKVLASGRGLSDRNIPTPDAGPDQYVSTGTLVTLDGSGSRDSWNNPLTFFWELIKRPETSQASLDNPGSVTPSFTPDADGNYLIQLTVENQVRSSGGFYRDTWEYTDRVLVVADSDNSRPVAALGSDQRVLTGNSVIVDGSASSDANNDDLTYDWYFVSLPEGWPDRGMPSLAVSPDGSGATFTPNSPGAYVLRLRVSDGFTRSFPATTIVTAKDSNTPPLADAGNNRTYDQGVMVTLDGSESSDPDCDPITFSWQIDARPAGSNAVLNDSGIYNPSLVLDAEGEYEFTLTVSDGIDTDTDSVTITATTDTGNEPPVADAGEDRTEVIEGPTTVYLDGTGSYDPDGDSLTYAWSQLAGPSVTFLPSISNAQRSFDTSQPGDYTFELIVNDGTVDSNPDTVNITLETAEGNTQPVADAGADQEIYLESQIPVTLDSSGSYDPDGDSLTYAWTQVSGPAVTLSDPSAPMPTFEPPEGGVYTFELIVNDGQVDSAPDQVSFYLEVYY
ncbi:MAG: hypothetical protein K9K62_08415 [Desulfobacteraceae bacterium]|nr:hypothetical protein [Desulfobacteraceae bacterium]